MSLDNLSAVDFADFDIARIAKEGFVYELMHPETGIAFGPKLNLRGAGDTEISDCFQRFEAIRMNSDEQRKRVDVSKFDAVTKTLQANLQEASNDLILKAVKSWEGVLEHGKPLEFNRDNVLRFFGVGSLFFKQVLDQVSDIQNSFTKAA